MTGGVTEFYCGVAPSAWAARYGASWLNRRSRGRANLPSMEHVANLVEKVHAHGLPVRVTLNAPFYTGEQLADVLALAGEITAAGADGLIVSDVGLILALRERGVASVMRAAKRRHSCRHGAPTSKRCSSAWPIAAKRHTRPVVTYPKGACSVGARPIASKSIASPCATGSSSTRRTPKERSSP